ncbi:Ribonuclease H-like domain [Phytophthora cactorum]|nr:Ribonuclease H-like domain [Phytophthora cactorum]
MEAQAQYILGLPLDKRARMSDWERRPLTQAQLHYAALDAHVLVQIYYKMQEQHPVDAFDAVLKRCTQKHVRAACPSAAIFGSRPDTAVRAWWYSDQPVRQ